MNKSEALGVLRDVWDWMQIDKTERIPFDGCGERLANHFLEMLPENFWYDDFVALAKSEAVKYCYQNHGMSFDKTGTYPLYMYYTYYKLAR